MNNHNIANLFEEISLMLELKGENPFKINAYKNASRTLLTLEKDVSILIKSDEISNIKGFGKNIIDKIQEFIDTNKIEYHSKLYKSFPPTLFELFKIKGLGPKKVKKLWELLNINSIGELEYACKENRLIKIEGFGIKTQNQILENIIFIKINSNKFLLNSALKYAEEISTILKSLSEVQKVEYVDKMRRISETFEDISFIILTDNQQKFIKNILSLKNFTLIMDENPLQLIFNESINIKLHFSNSNDYYLDLHNLTGSSEYLNNFEKYLLKMGFNNSKGKLSKNNQEIHLNSEEDFFDKINLQFIPPCLREGFDEIDLAINNSIPELIKLSDIKGALHVHTTYSDGSNTLQEMVDKAISVGLEYLGVSDHSKSAFYANGLKEDDILNQHKEIDFLNSKNKNFKILKGIESDILSDGDLDYPEDILKKFDFIVASIHSGFNLDPDTMTHRILKVVRNPYTTILGHPTGRLLLSRESFRCDIEFIIKECIKNNVIIELNCDEHRLDLEWKLIRKYTPLGLKISINTDAHNTSSLENIKLGILIAQKGMVSSKDVLNTMSFKNISDRKKKPPQSKMAIKTKM